MKTDRWIYGYRRHGNRALTEGEFIELRRLASRLSAQRFARGGLAVAVAIGALTGIIVAAHGSGWGWALLVLGMITFFVALNWANSAERLSMLFRRTVRLGAVDRYRLETAPFKLRQNWISDERERNGVSESYWQQEEGFYEALIRICGELPDEIEAPIEDGQPVRVGTVWTNRVLPAWSMELPMGPAE